MRQKSVLVIRYGGFGDVLQASSIFPGLAAEGYRVVLDTSGAGEAVVRHDPHLAHILVTPSGSVPPEKLGEYWTARANGFDRIVNLCEAVEETLLPTPSRLSFFHDDATRRRLFGRTNYVEHIHRIAGVAGPLRPRYHPLPAELDAAAARLGGALAILVCLAGSSEHKIWPHAQAFVLELLARTGHLVLLAGGEAARELAAEIAETAKDARLDTTRLLDMTSFGIRETLALSFLAQAVVGPETGVMNAVAHEAMRKVLILSHSSSENLARDWVNTVAVSPQVPCHPCHRLHASTKFCPRGPSGAFAACAEAVPADQVFAAVFAPHIEEWPMPKIQPTKDFEAWENGAARPLSLRVGETADVSADLAEILVRDGLAHVVDEQPAAPLALETLTKAELVALAKAELDLDLDSDAKKAELIAAIEAARAEKAKA